MEVVGSNPTGAIVCSLNSLKYCLTYLVADIITTIKPKTGDVGLEDTISAILNIVSYIAISNVIV